MPYYDFDAHYGPLEAAIREEARIRGEFEEKWYLRLQLAKSRNEDLYVTHEEYQELRNAPVAKFWQPPQVHNPLAWLIGTAVYIDDEKARAQRDFLLPGGSIAGIGTT
jgi:hypothetical protein